MGNKTKNLITLPLDANVNVDIRVLNGKGEVVQTIRQHNRATSSMTEGIVRFLRGEFNNTDLNINTVGNHADIAHYFIPSYIGFGNIGTNDGKQLPSEITGGDTDYSDYYANYTDSALYSEIFKIYNGNPGGIFRQENHRLSVQRSTKSDSKLTSTYSLTVSSIINFSSNFKFYYLNPTSTNPTGEVSYLHPCDVEAGLIEPQIVITELGLFSSDVTDNHGRLLARLLLSPDTPLIVSSTSTVIINWMIGVYSFKDTLLQTTTDSSDDADWDTRTTYNYTQDASSSVLWEEDS